jgi:hypothetical protein
VAQDETISVTARMRNLLSRPAREAKEDVEDLSDEVTELNARLEEQEKQARANKKALEALTAARGKDTRATRSQTKATQDQSKATKALAANAAAADKRLSKLNRGMLALGNIMKLFLVTGLISALPLLADGLMALAAGGTAAVAGLSPLVGLLIALPATMFAVVTALGATVFGLKGMGDALKEVLNPDSDPQKVAVAMNKLTGEGRVLAFTLQRLVQGPLRAMARSTQRALAPGLTAAIMALMPLIPVLNANLTDSAELVGNLAHEGARVAGSPMFSGQLNRIMKANNVALDDGAHAAGSLVLVLMDLLDAARPVTKEMAALTREGAAFLADASEGGRQSGGLRAFFKDAWELGKDVGAVLRDLAVALYNIGAQADEAAGKLGGSLMDKVERFRAWTESLQGQNAIRQWFTDALPVLSAFSKLIAALSWGMSEFSQAADLAPVIDQVTEELLPAFFELSGGLDDDLIPALIDVATAATKFLEIITHSPVPEVLGIMASGVLAIATAFKMLPGPVKTVIAVVLALTFAIKAMQFATAGMAKVFAGPVFTPIINGAREGSRGIGFFNRAAGGAVGAIGGFAAAGKGLFGAMGGPWGLAIAGAVAGLGLFMRSQQKSKARVDELRASLDQQTAALTDSTKETLIKSLEDEGVLKQAEEMGVALDLVTAAMMGQEGAMESLQAQLDAYAAPDIQFVANVPTNMSADEAEQVRDFNNAVNGLMEDTDSAVASQRRIIEANGGVGESSKDAAGSTNMSADALERQGRAADRTRGALKALNDELVGQQRTLIGFRQTMDDANGVLNKGRRTLNLHTQAGRDNKSALIDIAEAAAGVKNEAQRTQAIKEARKRIIEWYKAADLGADKGRKYANELFGVTKRAEQIPETVKSKFQLTGASAAEVELRRMKNVYDSLHDKEVTIRINRLGAGGAGPMRTDEPRKDGGPVWTGQRFLVGEVGPELYVGASGRTEMIGVGGQEHRTFPEAGWVVPNDELAFAHAPQAPAPAPAATEAPSSSDDGGPVPQIHNHWHGAGVPTEEEIEAATLRAWRKYEREKKERG